MARKVEDLVAEALQLPTIARAELAKELLASLDNISEEENEQLWIEEAERRYSDYKAGRATAIPAEEVFRRIESRKK